MIVIALVSLTLERFFESKLCIFQDKDKSKVMVLCFKKFTFSQFRLLHLHQWNISNQLFNNEVLIIIHMKIYWLRIFKQYICSLKVNIWMKKPPSLVLNGLVSLALFGSTEPRRCNLVCSIIRLNIHIKFVLIHKLSKDLHTPVSYVI